MAASSLIAPEGSLFSVFSFFSGGRGGVCRLVLGVVVVIPDCALVIVAIDVLVVADFLGYQ